ncbi:unnamed protein product [Caenorhabditis bovis]|uniref:ADF-H domain-containing protein n=1 Tax=Caenorhabditis bovis TaxID=2654633 RepID=A0A8S1ESB3_9PELO|nr:unnamed protein product [Caenorhabditis bovis]
MTLDYNEHRREIEAAYKRATESSDGDKWVIFDYERNSNTLKVCEEGTGGLSEFAESFSSGRLQFGVIAVRLSSDVLPKIVLVHWQGEGVQTLRLASARSHAEEFWKFLKTVHIILHARSEIDIEPDAIRKEVSKLPSTNTNANVESSYSIPEIHESSSKPTTRDEFWNKMNEEEKRRMAEEKKVREEEEKRRVAEEKLVNEMKQQQFEEDRKRIADDIHAKLQIQEKASSNGVDKTPSNTVPVSVLPSHNSTPVYTAYEVPPVDTSTFSSPYPSSSPPDPLSYGFQYGVVPKYTPEPEPVKRARSNISRDEFRNKKNEEEKK